MTRVESQQEISHQLESIENTHTQKEAEVWHSWARQRSLYPDYSRIMMIITICFHSNQMMNIISAWIPRMIVKENFLQVNLLTINEFNVGWFE